MRSLDEVKYEIDRATERRVQLWHSLAEDHDPAVRAELKQLEARLEDLWEEQRALRAHLRFGDRDQIIRRARTEERLLRAA